MYQSRSLFRHHFVVADAAPLIYGGVREINYCFPQSLFCLYLVPASAASSFAFFGSWWSVGNWAFLLENVMRNKAHAWNANIFKTKYRLGSAKKQFGIIPPIYPDRYVPSVPKPKFVWFKSPVELQNLLSRICEYWELCMQMTWERSSSISCAAPTSQ